jgi:proline iminopeptidase
MRRRHFILSASGILATLAAPRRAWAADPVSGRFAVTGGTLGYRRYGTAGRPYVLLSGGPGLNSSYVDPIAIELSHERTIVVLDQRGTGTSRDAIGDGSQLTVAGAIADLDALRAALGLTHLSLLGHSWGAMLSMAYAAAHGDRVASLVLLDPGGPDPSFFISFRQMLENHMTADDKAAAAAAQNDPQAQQRVLLPAYFHDRAKGVAFAAALPAQSSYPDVMRTMFNDVAAHYDVTAGLRNTPIPVLLIYGTDDPSRSASLQLDALFPHAAKAVIADAGHFPWVENPVPFYLAVRAFLSGAPPPS